MSEDEADAALQEARRQAGIPVSEVTVVETPAVPPAIVGKRDPVVANGAWVQGRNHLNVLQRAGRVEITADLDLEGLRNLKEVLTHYEAILELATRLA